ncbi:MAG: 16S rRNA processing protein RimM [Eubacterium sp.]|nr:16S rRNA processing protein RimM [Eubacterium sp.]
MKQFLELGKVNNTHGLKGEIKFSYWCDSIDYIRQLEKVYLDGEGKNALTVSSVRPQKNIAIMSFKEITNVEQAQELKNRVLYCNRDDAEIESDSYYLADLIGCSIVNAETGESYGTVCDIMNYGSCDIYDVKKEGKHTLIPATPDIINEIDTEKGTIKINVIKGLFDED